MVVTKMSPLSTFSISFISLTILIVPEAIPGETPKPFRIGSPTTFISSTFPTVVIALV
ncbi:MAG: hypothetical protein QW412_04025 [Candidatus Aenigmatarchaeota archaeon]